MKKLIKNSWTLGIGTTVIGGVLLSIILDLIKGIDILSTLKTVAKFIGNCIVAFLNFNIKVWWILIAIVILIGVLWVIAKCCDSKDKENKPQFLDYTQDYLLGYTWEWSWVKNWDGKYGVENLYPICGKCKTPLIKGDSYNDKVKCLRCNTVRQWNYSKIDEVKLLIYDNVKKIYCDTNA